jgi:hypothetical protein
MRPKVTDGDATRSQGTPLPDCHAGRNNAARPDEHAIPKVHASSQNCSRANVNTVSQVAIMVNGRTGVDDHLLPDLRAWLDHRPRKNYGSIAKAGPGRNDGCRMNQDRPPQTPR